MARLDGTSTHEILRKLVEALNVALKDQQVVEAVLRTGTTVVPGTSPDDLRQRIEHDVEMYARIARETNIKGEGSQ